MRSIAAALPALVAVSTTERLPPWVGVNVTLIVHVAKPASVAGQLFVWLKSPGFVPPKEMPVTPTLALELFVSVSGIAVLLSVIWVPLNEQVSGIPVQLEDDELRVSSGISVNVPITEFAPVVAVTTTGVVL